MSSSPSPTADFKTLEDFGYKFNSDGEMSLSLMEYRILLQEF